MKLMKRILIMGLFTIGCLRSDSDPRRLRLLQDRSYNKGGYLYCRLLENRCIAIRGEAYFVEISDIVGDH